MTPSFPWPPDDPEIHAVIENLMQSGEWGQYLGPHGPALEEGLRGYFSCNQVRLCSGGTAAVELALRGVRVGEGDEVVLAAYDFKANLANVMALGATPVLVDVAERNWNLDPERVAEAITERTRCILVSHLHGGIVPMRRLREIADDHGVPIVEDICQCPGARADGRPLGMWGDVGVLSFGGSKLLTAGRGGAVITNDAGIAQRIRLHVERGNDLSPLSEFQSAVLLPQLKKLDERNRIRQRSVDRILKNLPDWLSPLENLGAGTPAYYKLGLKFHPERWLGGSRDDFIEAVRAEGVQIAAGFRSLHRITASRRFRASGPLVEADAADERMLQLHHPVLLGSDAEVDRVIEVLGKTVDG